MVYMFLLCGFFQHCKAAVSCGHRWTVLLALLYSIVLIDCGLSALPREGRHLGCVQGRPVTSTVVECSRMRPSAPHPTAVLGHDGSFNGLCVQMSTWRPREGWVTVALSLTAHRPSDQGTSSTLQEHMWPRWLPW